MSNTIFKITNLTDGFTRRLAFSSAPSWAQLSGKLESIYGIREDDLCVSYIDLDGDEVVLSSSEELDDFYKVYSSSVEENVSAGQGDEDVRAIRFTVRSLSKVREGDETMTNETPANVPEVPSNVDVEGTNEFRTPEDDEESENGDTNTISSVDSSDVEEIPRGASLEAGPILEFETFILPHHFRRLGSNGPRGRGHHHHHGRGAHFHSGGHFHSRGRHHRGHTHLPPFVPHFMHGGVHPPFDVPPFPPHFGPTDVPMPPPHFGCRGRLGGRGGRGGRFGPHEHAHVYGQGRPEHHNHHHHHRGRHSHSFHHYFGARAGHAAPPPPPPPPFFAHARGGGFSMMHGVHVH